MPLGRRDVIVARIDAYNDGDIGPVQDQLISWIEMTSGRFLGLDGKIYGLKERFDELAGIPNESVEVSGAITTTGRTEILASGDVGEILTIRETASVGGDVLLQNEDAVAADTNVIGTVAILADGYDNTFAGIKLRGPVWAICIGGAMTARIGLQRYNR